jgi:hypothetical protein
MLPDATPSIRRAPCMCIHMHMHNGGVTRADATGKKHPVAEPLPPPPPPPPPPLGAE